MGGGDLIVAIDAVAREATLFAAIWFLVGGVDDLLVDLLFAWGAIRRNRRRVEPEPPPLAGTIAVFVPAWDESAVIAEMLETALARWAGADVRLFVGAYPNDRATIDAVMRVAERDARLRLVIGAAPGPTTKADCLNTLWRALLRHERAAGARVAAVALHDAEDIVHPREPELYARALAGCDAVQLPVLPLRRARSPLVSGHYCDEFAEAHAKALPVREALGAGLPFAGVGCAIRRDMLARIAGARGGAPFEATSLTEDYELGLTIAAMGGRSTFLRVREAENSRRPVAVRAYFPDRFDAAARQKARWLVGIALAGWDRTGWGPPAAIGDHWMRLRDRRATLAMPVLAIAYFALIATVLGVAGHAIAGSAPPALEPAMRVLLLANFALLVWRIAVRIGFVWQVYGWREARWAPLRMLAANIIALAAARRAALLYARMLGGIVPMWDKTAHHFPDDPEAATA